MCNLGYFALRQCIINAVYRIPEAASAICFVLSVHLLTGEARVLDFYRWFWVAIDKFAMRRLPPPYKCLAWRIKEELM